MEKVFFCKDLTGREFTANFTLDDILRYGDEASNDGDESLHEWAESAEIGDEFTTEDHCKYTRTE